MPIVRDLARPNSIVDVSNPRYRAFDVIAAGGVGVPITGTVAETVAASIIIPGRSMGKNGILRVTSRWSYPNSANGKTFRIRFGGLTGTRFLDVTATTTVAFQDQRMIANRNNEALQIGNSMGIGGGFGSTTSSLATSAVDTTQDAELVITGELASAAETMTLEAYIVELLRQ
jgi:hypothetical protein